MGELYDRHVTCPVCGIEFTTKKVLRSKLRVEKRDNDLFTHYKGENPIKYNVFICPLCGYSATEEKYESIRADRKEIVRDKITSRWTEREFATQRSVDDAIGCYKLALYCGEVLAFKKVYIGGICLSLAWLYRMKNDTANENKFMNFALRLFTQSYSNETLVESSMDEITLTYLIGELNRKIGNKSEAVQWFSQVISHSMIDTKPRIKKLAREQWLSVRETDSGVEKSNL